MTIEIVDFPIKNGGSFHSYVTNYQRVSLEAEFRFLDLGRLAYLGQSQAVAELGVGSTTVSKAKGTAAFLLWRSVYIATRMKRGNRRSWDGIDCYRLL